MALICSKLHRCYGTLWYIRTTHSHHQRPSCGFYTLLSTAVSLTYKHVSQAPSPHTHLPSLCSLWVRSFSSLFHSAVHHRKNSPTCTTFSLQDKNTSWIQKNQALPVSLYKLSASVTAGKVPHPTHTATHVDMSIGQTQEHCCDMVLVKSTAKGIFWISFCLWVSSLFLCSMSGLPFGEVAFEKIRILMNNNKKSAGQNLFLSAQQYS